VEHRKIWLTTTTRVPCSNAAKTRNQLKFAGVPQTCQQISAVSGPKITILWGHVEDVLLFNKFFFMDHTVLPTNNTMPAFPCQRSPDVTTTATDVADIELQLTTHLSTPKK